VHQHASRVEDTAQARFAQRRELIAEAAREVTRIHTCSDLFACARQQRPRRLDGKRIVACAGQLVDRGKIAQLHARPV
jgi:hypothetical protein